MASKLISISVLVSQEQACALTSLLCQKWKPACRDILESFAPKFCSTTLWFCAYTCVDSSHEVSCKS
uniref:Uncharacterized protein n=1 Tax=Triticum urartu TaxID=4572 RepID=A0A8R7NYE7_TRIUA